MKPILITLLMLCLSFRAAADGCMFVLTDEQHQQLGLAHDLAQSPKQEAILAYNGSEVRVILRTHFRNGPTQLAWLIPVPAEPTDVRAERDDVFDVFARETEPRFELVTYQRQSTGMSCGCAAAPSTVESKEPIKGLHVSSQGTAGIFDFTVLHAESSKVLLQWLNQRGGSMPESTSRAVNHYVHRGWSWLALRVLADPGTAETLAPHPVSFRYLAEKPQFPLIISAPFSADENEIILYVLGYERAQAANWSNAVIPAGRLALDRHSPSGTTYEQWLHHHGASDHLFVTECARRLDGVPPYSFSLASVAHDVGQGMFPGHPKYLTRLRTVASPATLDRDVDISPSKDQFDVSNEVKIRKITNAPRRLMVVAAAPLALVALRTRRRSTHRAALAFALLAILFT